MLTADPFGASILTPKITFQSSTAYRDLGLWHKVDGLMKAIIHRLYAKDLDHDKQWRMGRLSRSLA